MILEQAHQQILSDTALRIFEEAAFALADPPEDGRDEGYPAGPLMSCAVKFIGPFTGVITIIAPERLVSTLAANMMGLDESNPDTSEKPSDALGEILNMICGNLLPAMAGEKPEFRIMAPREVPVEISRQFIMNHPGEATAQIQLFIEGCKTEIALLVDAETA